tara:strand:- start:7999 stop:8151 length:153 start_codon:yes stop_codon:yes gene_type:complete
MLFYQKKLFVSTFYCSKLIFSTLKDGFVFKKESVDKILEDFKKEKSLIIA